MIFAGEQREVLPWLQALDVFALPSYANEGVPQAILQAMACELPVVATAVGAIPEERPRTYVPAALLVGVIVALAVISFTVHDFPYASGLTVLTFALIGWLWHLITEQPHGASKNFSPSIAVEGEREGEASMALSKIARRFRTLRERLRPGHELLRQLDWETTLFLVGIFVIVGSLSATGAIAAFTDWFSGIVGASPLRAYVLIVAASIALSAFIDNVPFVLAMLPVAQGVAASIGIQPFLLYAGLLIGASVGGNITPIGASANIVAYRWIEERAKEPITFLGYVRYGLPFTLIAVGAAAVFGWYVWSP